MVFQQGRANGISKSLSSQNKSTQSKVLEIIEQNIDYADTVFISELATATKLSSLKDKMMQQRILKMAENDIAFACGLEPIPKIQT
jgi:hypothetical protein